MSSAPAFAHVAPDDAAQARRSPVLPPLAVTAHAVPRGPLPFAFGSRTPALLVIGLLWLIPAFLDDRFVVALAAWNVLVFAAWLFDLLRLPPAAALRVTRSWRAISALSVPAEVDLTIENTSDRPLLIQAIDAVPAVLRAEPPDLAFALTARRSATRSYTVRPIARGLTPVGDVFLRCQSPLHLAERWLRAPVAQTIVTCPNVVDARKQSLLLVQRRQGPAERRVTRVRGAGRAFESLREYRAGDEIRDICWTASARRGKLVTRLYEIERSQTIWLLVDAGRLMRARVAGATKLDHAIQAALTLADVAIDSGDRVGVLAYGRHITARVPAASGRTHLKTLVEQLALVRDDEWEGDHLLAAGRLLADQQRRGLVVWITDMAETAMTPEVVRAASQLLARHVVVFVVIGQPDVQAVAARRPSDESTFFETSAARELALRRDLLLARLREQGAIAFESTAAGLSAAIVNSYLDVKARNRL